MTTSYLSATRPAPRGRRGLTVLASIPIISPLFQVLLNTIGWVLAGIYHVIPNYGVAIIILTLLLRVLLVPLGVKQIKSMRTMQALQPKIEDMQKKYKGNKPKIQEETMRLYKEAGVNPLGAVCRCSCSSRSSSRCTRSSACPSLLPVPPTSARRADTWSSRTTSRGQHPVRRRHHAREHRAVHREPAVLASAVGQSGGRQLKDTSRNPVVGRGDLYRRRDPSATGDTDAIRATGLDSDSRLRDGARPRRSRTSYCWL